MQLMKQSRGNGTPTAPRAWELLALVASTMPPSKEYVGLVSEYVHNIAHHDGDLPEGVRELALRAWHALKRSAKAGARITVCISKQLFLRLASPGQVQACSKGGVTDGYVKAKGGRDYM